MSHQVTKWPELPTTSWVLSDPKSHEVGGDSSLPAPNGSGVYEIRLEQSLKAQISNLRKWPKCPWTPLLLYGFLSPSLHLVLHGELPVTIDRGKEDSGLVYRRFCIPCQNYWKVDSCSIMTTSWDNLEGEWWREILPMDKTSSTETDCSFCLEGKMNRCTVIYWFMDCDQWLVWIVKETSMERTWLENWWQGRLGKRYVDRPE